METAKNAIERFADDLVELDCKEITIVLSKQNGMSFPEFCDLKKAVYSLDLTIDLRCVSE